MRKIKFKSNFVHTRARSYIIDYMKIDLRKYQPGKHYFLEDDVDFSSHVFAANYRIRAIKKCHIKIDLVIFEEIINLSIKMDGTVIGACSYTNEDVPLNYHVKENMSFSPNEGEADYLEEGDIIDLDLYLYSLIDNAIPLNIIKKGAKLPNSGLGYEVISEEDYLNKKKNKDSSPWDKLNELDLDD